MLFRSAGARADARRESAVDELRSISVSGGDRGNGQEPSTVAAAGQ
ncbi:hypothetical protein MOQ72_17850 [Saccharopolyspora sp. K220]|nr:hypothetical protein [Saccharopolyspora soli]MCI2419311.1 hypothetical protein [Saccharopolyspora soli]